MLLVFCVPTPDQVLHVDLKTCCLQTYVELNLRPNPYSLSFLAQTVGGDIWNNFCDTKLLILRHGECTLTPNETSHRHKYPHRAPWTYPPISCLNKVQQIYLITVRILFFFYVLWMTTVLHNILAFVALSNVCFVHCFSKTLLFYSWNNFIH